MWPRQENQLLFTDILNTIKFFTNQQHTKQQTSITCHKKNNKKKPLPDTDNVKLIKKIPKGEKVYILENLYIHTQKSRNNTPVSEQTQMNTKYNIIFDALIDLSLIHIFFLVLKYVDY